MRNGRTDGNHTKIVRELRQLGYAVQSLADLGDGVPDIIIAPRNVLIEIKDPSQPPSKRRLTPQEKKWHEVWLAAGGQVATCETTEEILKVLDSRRKDSV